MLVYPMNSIKNYIPIVVVCLKACMIELLCHSLCIWLYLYLRWRRSYYIVFLSETFELHLYLMWRGSWILCQLGPQSSALLAPQGQVLGIQRAASNLEQNRVCIWGFLHLYLCFFICVCIFSPVFALEIRGSVCEHLPGTKGPSARHHPQEAGGERNQSNQILLGLTERHFKCIFSSQGISQHHSAMKFPSPSLQTFPFRLHPESLSGEAPWGGPESWQREKCAFPLLLPPIATFLEKIYFIQIEIYLDRVPNWHISLRDYHDLWEFPIW